MINNISISLDNFVILAEMTKVEIMVIRELFKRISLNEEYKDVIVLNSSIRKDIVSDLNIKTSSLNNSLNNLCKKNIIKRLDTNMYTINNDIFKY